MLIETAQALMENATYNASRVGKTGYTGTGQNQAQTIGQVLTTELQSYGGFIDTTQITLTSTSYSSFSGSGTGTGGATGYGTQQQIVVYNITYPWKIFTPMVGQLLGTMDAQGNYILNLTSHIVVRNEPYG